MPARLVAHGYYAGNKRPAHGSVQGRRRHYTGHFRIRMGQRHVPSEFAEGILRRGARARSENEYKITHLGHHVILVKYTCNLILVTIFKG